MRVYDAGTGHELKAFFFAGNVEALAWVEADEKGGGGEGAGRCLDRWGAKSTSDRISSPLPYTNTRVRTHVYTGSGADSPSKGKTPYLVIASRNVAHLTYVDSRTWEKRGVSLNQVWGGWVWGCGL